MRYSVPIGTQNFVFGRYPTSKIPVPMGTRVPLMPTPGPHNKDHCWFRIWFRENAYLCDAKIFELSYKYILCFEISVDLVSYFTWLEKMYAACQILQSFLVKIIVLCISLSKFSWALSRFNLHTPDKITLFEVNKVENRSNEKFFKSFKRCRKIMFSSVNLIVNI